MRRGLTVAGSDSGGGAGIQADLKTFAALGVYGVSAITSITAQNTQGIFGVFDLPAEFVGLQIEVVVEDIGVDAVKTGMLPTGDIIAVVAKKVREYTLPNLVVDPVLMTGSGQCLVQAEAREALVKELFPLAEVVTPNLSEASELTGLRVMGVREMKEAARELHRLGPKYVVVKGGHLPDSSIDILFDGQRFRQYSHPRIQTKSDHGTGCTFASAIAAGLAKGLSVEQAVEEAKDFVTSALRHGTGLSLGKGRGPVHHFGQLYEATGLSEVE